MCIVKPAWVCLKIMSTNSSQLSFVEVNHLWTLISANKIQSGDNLSTFQLQQEDGWNLADKFYSIVCTHIVGPSWFSGFYSIFVVLRWGQASHSLVLMRNRSHVCVVCINTLVWHFDKSMIKLNIFDKSWVFETIASVSTLLSKR